MNMQLCSGLPPGPFCQVSCIFVCFASSSAIPPFVPGGLLGGKVGHVKCDSHYMSVSYAVRWIECSICSTLQCSICSTLRAASAVDMFRVLSSG